MSPALKSLAVAVLALAFASLSRAQSLPVIHLTNDAGLRADDTLGDGDPFVTNFKGLGDVTITQLIGGVEGSFVDNFGGATPGNNPAYLRDFVGADGTGTGDGSTGGLAFLHSDANEPNTSWQFDFAQPLTSTDRLVFADIDIDEQYRVQAFSRLADGSYQTLDLNGWHALAFSGMTGLEPDNAWAAWDPASGTLTANDDGLDEPLNVLIPDLPVDRLIVSKLAGDGASAGFQIIALPVDFAPTVTMSVAIAKATVGAGDHAQFTLSLDEPLAETIFVHYTIKGSGLNGTDYNLLSGTKKVKAGKTTKPIKIFPQGNLEGAGKKVIKLTLAPGDGYTVGTTTPQKVKIYAAP